LALSSLSPRSIQSGIGGEAEPEGFLGGGFLAAGGTGRVGLSSSVMRFSMVDMPPAPNLRGFLAIAVNSSFSDFVDFGLKAEHARIEAVHDLLKVALVFGARDVIAGDFLPRLVQEVSYPVQFVKLSLKQKPHNGD
jgi:hypothetical protein